VKWFRFYRDTLDNPTTATLDPATFKAWVLLMCLASERNHETGTIDLDVQDIAWRLRVSEQEAGEALERLISVKILRKTSKGYTFTGWQGKQYLPGDDSAKRKRESRARAADSDKDPDPEKTNKHIRTDTEQNRYRDVTDSPENVPGQSRDNKEAMVGGEDVFSEVFRLYRDTFPHKGGDENEARKIWEEKKLFQHVDAVKEFIHALDDHMRAQFREKNPGARLPEPVKLYHYVPKFARFLEREKFTGVNPYRPTREDGFDEKRYRQRYREMMDGTDEAEVIHIRPARNEDDTAHEEPDNVKEARATINSWEGLLEYLIEEQELTPDAAREEMTTHRSASEYASVRRLTVTAEQYDNARTTLDAWEDQHRDQLRAIQGGDVE